jgi:hypothetical protein
MRRHVLFSVCFLVLSILVYASTSYAYYVMATASASVAGSSASAWAEVRSGSDAVWNGWYNTYASVNGSGPSNGGSFSGYHYNWVSTIAYGSNSYAYAGISGKLYGMTYVGSSMSASAP